MSQFEVIPSISVGDDTSDVDATTVTATPSEVQQQSSKSPPILKATCVCEQFCLELEGQPIRLSICHCLACQKRTGSTFGEQGNRSNSHQWFIKISALKNLMEKLKLQLASIPTRLKRRLVFQKNSFGLGTKDHVSLMTSALIAAQRSAGGYQGTTIFLQSQWVH